MADTLEDKIKAGMDAAAGSTVQQPLPDLPPQPAPAPIIRLAVVNNEPPITVPEPTLSEIREQQIKDAMAKAALNNYEILKAALENCLQQSQHFRQNEGSALEACKQIEQICVGALADLP